MLIFQLRCRLRLTQLQVWIKWKTKQPVHSPFSGRENAERGLLVLKEGAPPSALKIRP